MLAECCACWAESALTGRCALVNYLSKHRSAVRLTAGRHTNSECQLMRPTLWHTFSPSIQPFAQLLPSREVCAVSSLRVERQPISATSR